MSHRLSEWCSRAPDLEEDIALANIALDLLGQARLLLARAAAADPSSCRRSPGLAGAAPRTRWRSSATTASSATCASSSSRTATSPTTIVRLLLFSTWRLALLRAAAGSPRPRARRGRGQGRQGGHLPPRLRGPLVPHPGAGHRGVAPPAARRPRRGLAVPRRAVRRTPSSAVAAAGVGVDPAAAPPRSTSCSSRCFAVSGVDRPDPRVGPIAGDRPRRRHTEALSPAARRDAGRRPRTPEGRW